MSLKDEMFSGELSGDSYVAEDPVSLDEMVESDSGADTKRREVHPVGHITDERALAEEHEIASSRAVEDRILRRYQEQERARIPDLLGKIASTEFTPRYRQGHRIGGEEGRKGKRGL